MMGAGNADTYTGGNIDDVIRSKADRISDIVRSYLPDIEGFPKTVCQAME